MELTLANSFRVCRLLAACLTQGVALGWNLQTPSALVSELYGYNVHTRLPVVIAPARS